MNRRRLLPLPLLAPLLALLLVPAGIAAQAGDDDGCPVKTVEVEYEGAEAFVCPADGAIVGLVVSLSTTTTETLEGVETTKSGTAAWFAAEGDGYVLAADGVALTARQAAAEGIAVGDVLVGVLAEEH